MCWNQSVWRGALCKMKGAEGTDTLLASEDSELLLFFRGGRGIIVALIRDTISSNHTLLLVHVPT